MKWAWTEIMIVALSVIPRVGMAQGVDSPTAPLVALPADGAPATGAHPILAAFVIAAVASAVLLAIAKLNDFRRGREDRVVDLTVRISTALLEHPVFFRSSVIPTVTLPLWRGAPARITMTGNVPSPELARTAMRLARDAASQSSSAFTIENRMAVVPLPAGPAGDASGDAKRTRRVGDALKTASSVVGVAAGLVLLKYAFVLDHFNFK